MDYFLENEFILVKVSSLGAELKGITNKENNLAYLWEGNEKYWKRSSPILFPNVGKYYNGSFSFENKVYKQSQHGFARDNEFKFLKADKTSLSLIFEANSETLKVYPFDFSLVISYELIGKEIKVTWEVMNKGQEKMYYQIGGHPAFNCPLFGGVRSDYYLLFKGKEEIISNKCDSMGYKTDEVVNFKLANGYLEIKDDLFKDDALVIAEQGIKEVSLCLPNKKPYLTVKMNVPLFGVWSSSSDAPFVCIEPWYGRCDSVGFNKQLDEREYEYSLNPLESFKNVYSIVIE